jgi:hypothetical protein
MAFSDCVMQCVLSRNRVEELQVRRFMSSVKYFKEVRWHSFDLYVANPSVQQCTFFKISPRLRGLRLGLLSECHLDKVCKGSEWPLNTAD